MQKGRCEICGGWPKTPQHSEFRICRECATPALEALGYPSKIQLVKSLRPITRPPGWLRGAVRNAEALLVAKTIELKTFQMRSKCS